MSLEAAEGEPAELPETAGHAAPGDPVELDPVELPEEVEPTELVGLAEPVDEAEALGPGHRRRGLLLAAVFAVAALAIVGGAIGTVGALTHGFKKPVTIKYHESAVFKLQTGDCVSAPNGQVVSVLPCSAPHQAEVFATFALPAFGVAGDDRGAERGQLRLCQPAHGVPEPAARHQPGAVVRVPQPGCLDGRDQDGDLRGAGGQRPADPIRPRRLVTCC